MNLLRTADESDRFLRGLVQVDQAFFASEQKWGVGRLERLVGPKTSEAYQRGWVEYRRILEEGDGAALEIHGPKMVAALQIMEAEAVAAGHSQLAPETWEAPMGNGVTLVLVRTTAEASAVIRAANAKDNQASETTIPPDIAVTVRSQHEGRALVVVTIAEVVRLFQAQETGLFGTKWEGNEAHSGVQKDEMMAHDLVRQGWPLEAPPTAQSAPKPALAF